MEEREEFVPGMTRREFNKLLADAAAPSAGKSRSNPAVTLIDAVAARASPAAFAAHASRNAWRLAPHLALLNRLILCLAARVKKRILVTFPPRHGKSRFLSGTVPAWWLGSFPDQRVILGSYGADLAFEWSAKAKLLLETYGPSVFGVSVRGNSSDWKIIGREGGCRAAGVGGPITGFGADLLVLDDLIKNSEEAQSELVRKKTWEWFVSTAYTRLEPNGVAIMIATRWHDDDPIGRVITKQKTGELDEEWELFNFPAIAEEDEPAWPLSIGRKKGDALWPDRYDVDALNKIHKAISEYWWSALYMQRPVPKGGGMFKDFYFNGTVPAAPFHAKRIRYWDRAATEDGGCWTAGVLLSKDESGDYFIEHAVRGQWEPATRDKHVLATANRDRDKYGESAEPVQHFELEPGSAGIDQYRATARLLAGFKVRSERPSGEKAVRAEPWSCQLAAGNVKVVRDGSWNVEAYIAEHVAFPMGTYCDQVDASSGAFNLLSNRRKVGETIRALPISARRIDGQVQQGLKIVVASRQQAADGIGINAPYFTVAIEDSPRDAEMNGEPHHLTPDESMRVIPLEFEDLDPAHLAQHQDTLIETHGNRPARELIMTKSDAASVWREIMRKDWPIVPKAMLIYCYAGRSRSLSMALAICDAMRWPRSNITWLNHDDTKLDKYEPTNRHVYEMMRAGKARMVI